MTLEKLEMAILNLPNDLVSCLCGQANPQLASQCYGILRLVTAESLRIETLYVTPAMADFANVDPHNQTGSYAVPAVNLIDAKRFPAWALLWLPNERRYGSFDLEHGDLMMFSLDVTWSRIAAAPDAYIIASDSCGDEKIPMEYLKPWPIYPWIES